MGASPRRETSFVIIACVPPLVSAVFAQIIDSSVRQKNSVKTVLVKFRE